VKEVPRQPLKGDHAVYSAGPTRCGSLYPPEARRPDQISWIASSIFAPRGLTWLAIWHHLRKPPDHREWRCRALVDVCRNRCLWRVTPLAYLILLDDHLEDFVVVDEGCVDDSTIVARNDSVALRGGTTAGEYRQWLQLVLLLDKSHRQHLEEERGVKIF